MYNFYDVLYLIFKTYNLWSNYAVDRKSAYVSLVWWTTSDPVNPMSHYKLLLRNTLPSPNTCILVELVYIGNSSFQLHVIYHISVHDHNNCWRVAFAMSVYRFIAYSEMNNVLPWMEYHGPHSGVDSSLIICAGRYKLWRITDEQ